MKNEPKIEKKLTIATEYLRSIGCSEVILFGSWANGTAGESSDIDLAVAGISPRTYFKTAAVISSMVGRKVDLITIDYIHKDFEERIRKEGKILYAT
jgi:predicted nucleotidyltransferase